MATETTIATYPELRKLAPAIVARYGNDLTLATAALANPVLALEAAGYKLSPKLKATVEERLRFGETAYKQLLSVRKNLHAKGGKNFDPLDPDATNTLLNRLTKSSGEYSQGDTRSRTLKINIDSIKEVPFRDPLEDRIKDHPIVTDILEYRRIHRTAPPFASPEDFKKLQKTDLSKRGDIRLSAVNFRYREPE